MRAVGFVLLAAFAGGCTSVKMVQRDGCWVKRTEKIFGRVREEIGPCSRPQPKWAEDRLTRLVQECVAQSDYRWQGRAIDAWSKGKPYPAQPPQDETLRSCLGEARAQLMTEKDNETLKSRVEELSADRSTLRHDTDQDRAALRASHDRLVEHLGEAAKKPPPAPAYATATATSDGRATNESGANLSSGSTSGSGANGLPGAPGSAILPTTPASASAPEAAPKEAAPPPVAASPSPGAQRPTAPANASRPKVARARRPPPMAQAAHPPPCDVPAAKTAGPVGCERSGDAAPQPEPARP